MLEKHLSMDWFNLLRSQRIIWQYSGAGPHASYSLNDRHSDFYFNSNFLISNPPLLKAVVLALYDQLKAALSVKPTCVVTYPPYGMNVAFSLAELFEAKFAYVKLSENAPLEFELTARDNILFCADDLYTGGSFRSVKSCLFKSGLELMEPLVVVANFSGQLVFDGYQVESLLSRTISSWSPSECPLCQAGSEAIMARTNWKRLTDFSS